MGGDHHPFPCNRCVNCRSNRVSEWSFRLRQEALKSDVERVVFATLTYASPPMTSSGFMTLDKRDLQLFWKRLRKASTKRIRYYAVGEYGSKYARPHYHAIIYNAIPSEIELAWQAGSCHFGTLTPASIGYTLKYLYKDRKSIGYADWDDRLPQFSVSSQRLGDNYLTADAINYHKSALLHGLSVITEDGVFAPLPRYFKSKIFSNDEKEKIAAMAAATHVRASSRQLHTAIVERSADQLRRRSVDSEVL